MENTYEEVVLQTVMKDILQGTCHPTTQEGQLPDPSAAEGIPIARRGTGVPTQRFSWWGS